MRLKREVFMKYSPKANWFDCDSGSVNLLDSISVRHVV